MTNCVVLNHIDNRWTGLDEPLVFSTYEKAKNEMDHQYNELLGKENFNLDSSYCGEYNAELYSDTGNEEPDFSWEISECEIQ